jgi:polysaccharide biosynthesis protein PslG
MNKSFVGPVRSCAVRLVIATAATATVCVYCSGLANPSPRLSSAAYVDTAAITDSSTTIGIADSDLYGETPAEIDQTLDTLQSIGVQNIRIFVPWAFVEPSQGTYDWTQIDEVVDAAAARNMGVLAEINATPSWAGTSAGSLPGSATPNDADFASFASAVATRYGNDISAYEIWNEPNSVQFSSPIDPVAYANLLKAAYPAIKAANPNATVIAGAVGSTITIGSLTLDPTTFISEMYAAGAQGYFDALSFHPYDETLEFSQGASVANSPLNQLNAIYQIMVANGDAGKQIWATEYGLPTSDVSQQTQATFIQDFLSSWSTLSYAGPAFIYTAQDGTSTDPTGTYGIYNADWTPKLAVAVIEAAIAKEMATNPITSIGQQITAVLAQAIQSIQSTIQTSLQSFAQSFAQSIVNAIATALGNALAAAATPAVTPAVTSPTVNALVKTMSLATPSATSATTDPSAVTKTAIVKRTRMGWVAHTAFTTATTVDSTTSDTGKTSTDDPKHHESQHDSGTSRDGRPHLDHQHPATSGDSTNGDSGHKGHAAGSRLGS